MSLSQLVTTARARSLLSRRLHLSDRAKLETSLYEFTRAAWPILESRAFIPNWHIEAICEHMEAFARGEIPLLIINMPPRHLKSKTISVMYPSWRWTTNPQIAFLCLTYGQALSARDANHMRRLIRSPWYQELWGDRFHIMEDQDTKLHFDNNCGGSRLSRSVQKGVIGQGGDEILIDDPHDTDNLDSDEALKVVCDFHDDTITTRMNDQKNFREVVMMHRLRENDLCGHLIEKNPDAVVLKLPEEFDPDHRCMTIALPSTAPYKWEDPRQIEGAILSPDYIGAAELRRIKNNMTAHGYAGMYQQEPSARAGEIFERVWFENRYKENEKPRFHQIVQSWDTAEKDLQSSAFSVCTTWGTYGMDAYLLDVWRQKCKTNILYDAAIELQQRWQPDDILVEDKSSGTGLINMLRTRSADSFGNRLRGGASIIAIQVPSKEDKEHRAESSQSFWATARGKLPMAAPWLNDWINEHIKFPNSKYKDQVDSTSQFVKWFTRRRFLQRVLPANIVPIFQR